MPRKAKKASAKPDFVLFNVTYEDGTLSSNRRVPADVLDDPDGEEAVRRVIEDQDREVAEKSGRRRAPIKSIKKA